MKTPEWLKPALWGAVAGAVGITIVGFSWGGWVTGGTAEEMARERAETEVLAELAPICVAQAEDDPQFKEKFTEVTEVSSYQQRDALAETGWATMPGEEEADRDVADACLDALKG